MLVMPSNNLMATIGKEEHLKFAKTDMPTLEATEVVQVVMVVVVVLVVVEDMEEVVVMV